MDIAVSWFMLGATARMAIAVILALAAMGAMRDWTGFAGIVEQYRVAPRWLLRFATWALPPLELTAAAALVVPATSHSGGVLGLCLMALFSMAIAVNLARGRVSIDCGCGGADGQRLSVGLLLRNLAIMSGLVVSIVAPTTGPVTGATAVGVTGASLTLIAIYFAANQLMTNLQAIGALRSRSPQ